MTTSPAALLGHSADHPSTVLPGHRPAASDSDEWYTPLPLVEAARALMGRIDLDPASCEAAQAVVRAGRFYGRDDDGLVLPWYGRVWLNPPYSRPLLGRFVAKLVAEADAGRVEQAVVLVNTATDAEWFQALAERYPVLFTRRRVRFWRNDRSADSPRYGQALFGVGVELRAFANAFAGIAYLPLGRGSERNACSGGSAGLRSTGPQR